MQGIFQKENTDKALKYGIYRHLPTYEKIIRNLVSFYLKKLTEQDIISYVNSGKCMDKAGSYGIQECDFVDHIEGDYTNVVGLPKYVVESIMKDVAL